MTYKVYGNKKGYKNKLQTVLEIVKDDLKRMKNIEECVINDNEALIKLGEVFSKNKEEILNFFNLYKSIIKYEGELSSIDILNDCELSNHYHNFAQMVFIINNESIDKSIKQKEIKIENDDEFLEVFERLIRSYRKLNKFVSELCHVSNNYSNDYLERMVSRIFNCYIEFENFNTVEIMKYKIKMRFAKIRKSLHKK